MTTATPVNECRSCGSRRLVTVLDLGETPIANAILNVDADLSTEQSFPLAIAFCEDCTLVQLAHELQAGEMFNDDYPYYSSFSEALCRHARSHATDLIEHRHLDASSFVVEVASNDGYLLKNFVAEGIPVLGVDPCSGPAAAAVAAGVPTKVEFFGVDAAQRIVEEHGKADVIIANNVMAHVPDLNDFVGGFAALLADDGVLTVENPSVKELIDHVEFDTIYHEHFCYFSCLAVDALMKRHGLHLNDVEFFADLHGGTLRWYVQKHAAPTQRLMDRLALERSAGMGTVAYYETFADRVATASESLRSLLRDLKASGASIAAYGAAAKGSTLVNTVGIGPEIVDYVVDRNTHKQNHLMPGTHQPIYDVTALATKVVDYVVLLAWNFKDEIMAQQAAFAERGGHFIVPLPVATVL